MIEVAEEEINMAVAESKLAAEEMRAFTEAKLSELPLCTGMRTMLGALSSDLTALQAPLCRSD